MTGHTQFLRKATLVIGNSTAGIDLSNMQFSFAIKQADVSSPQSATIKVYNLSKTTENLIKVKEFSRVILQAGYQQGAFGVIFDGEIVQARIGRDSPVDTYFDILAAEGYSAFQAVVNKTLAAGSTPLDAANAGAAAMAQSLINYGYDPKAKLPRGQVLYGMARDTLHQAAATAGCSYYFQKGAISFVPLQGFIPGTAVVLRSDTGMIGWPELTQDGLRARCLLNPLLDVGSTVRIDNGSIIQAALSTNYEYNNTLPSLDADGLYRVYVIEHRGDTRGLDWYSDLVLLSIDKANAGLTSLVQKGQF